MVEKVNSQLSGPEDKDSVANHSANECTLLMHAAMVSSTVRAIALTGTSGAGKSTLSAALRRYGWNLLGDDTLVVSFDQDPPVARALFPQLRLEVDSASHFPTDDLEESGIDSFGKHVFHLPEMIEPRPLDAVFVLAIVSTDTITTERLSPSDACFVILGNSFAQDADDLEEASKRFRLAADLASQVPVFRFSYPRNFNVIPRVAAAITETLEGVSSTEKI